MMLEQFLHSVEVIGVEPHKPTNAQRAIRHILRTQNIPFANLASALNIPDSVASS